MRTISIAALAGILLSCVIIGVLAQGSADQAKADLKGADGKSMGTVILTDTPHGVLLHVTLTGVPEGVHAFHIHTTGKCEPPFTTAGGHFNPASKQHGVENPMGMHAGDLANITVPASGMLTFDAIDPDVTLKPGANSLLDADGSAIVIHAAADDYKGDPAGNAGARIGCGVVVK